MSTRRKFLIQGAIGASSALLPGLLRAAQPEPRVLADWHSHYVSDAELRFLAGRSHAPNLVAGADGVLRLQNVDTASAVAGGPSEFTRSDIAARLRQLDQNGIQRQLLTQTVAMGFDASLTVQELRTLYRAFNDELAQVVAVHPTRFLAVAALPSADPQWAAQELNRGHRELGFIGGSLPLNAFATLKSANTLAPVFAAAQKLGSHVFVHRASASASLPDQPPVVIPEDTGYARWTLINNAHLAAGGITLGLSDFLDPYPDVTVEIVMLGGFLPYLLDTWVTAGRATGVADPLARLRRVYFDTGPYATRNADWVALAANKLGADRILFGTDYGVGGGARGEIAPALAALNMALTPAQRQTIYVDNSRALLQRYAIIK